MDVIGKYKSLFKDENKLVAIIGSREASERENELAYSLASRLVSEGKIIVSGLAKGIDSYAHLGAVDSGGLTVGLVSTPSYKSIYPKENVELAEKIKNNGSIVHLFDTNDNKMDIYPPHFQRRLIERSIFNAYICSKIFVISNKNIIEGGTRWCTNYGIKYDKKEYQVKDYTDITANLNVKKCKLTWNMELYMLGAYEELKKL